MTFSNKPAERTQVDELQDDYSLESGLACDPRGDRARQEYKDEADINLILKRYGVNAPQRQVTHAEIDFDMDLQQGLDAIAQAKQAWTRLPGTLKTKYPTWQSVLNGLESGQLRLDMDARKVKPQEPEPGKSDIKTELGVT